MSEISDEMVEVAARDIHAAAWGPGQWETSGESEHREMLAMARAALSAAAPMIRAQERERCAKEIDEATAPKRPDDSILDYGRRIGMQDAAAAIRSLGAEDGR